MDAGGPADPAGDEGVAAGVTAAVGAASNDGGVDGDVEHPALMTTRATKAPSARANVAVGWVIWRVIGVAILPASSVRLAERGRRWRFLTGCPDGSKRPRPTVHLGPNPSRFHPPSLRPGAPIGQAPPVFSFPEPGWSDPARPHHRCPRAPNAPSL